MTASTSFRAAALGLLLPLAACTSAADDDGAPRFPDFELTSDAGPVRTLADFKAPVTLINFFFPT